MKRKTMADSILKGKKILLGVTGGIAAYKTPLLVRLLKKEGAEVQAVMTENAKRFVTPLVLATLTERPAYSTMWPSDEALERIEIAHIAIADWADALVVAPATANCLGKLASGLADDLLSTTLLTVICPVLLCPAMTTSMFENPIVAENVARLEKHGYRILPPDTGELACKKIGPGRMPEPEAILERIKILLAS